MLASVLYSLREVESKRTSPSICFRRCFASVSRRKSVKSCMKGIVLAGGAPGKASGALLGKGPCEKIAHRSQRSAMNLIPEMTKIVLGPDWNGAQMTPEEFDAIEEYDEEYTYELIHGVLVVNPIPLGEETGPNELLGHFLIAYKDDHPQGGALDNTLPQQYVRTRTGLRLADRVIWAGLGRTPHRLNDRPTVVVEFVAASKRDRRRDYIEK